MDFHFKVANNQSDIYIKRDIRNSIKDYIDLSCKVFILSDDGVPYEYIQSIANQCLSPFIKIVKHGEIAKSLSMVKEISEDLYQNNFNNEDIIFAVGGGVIGDLSGFVASIYRQGIRVISLPTTTLSQIDSSIGGKTAVNLSGVKNIIGSFYQPTQVFIDLNTLSTLTRREYYSGLVEALKAGMIRDPELFNIFKYHVTDFKEDIPPNDLEEIMVRALKVKRDIVEQDEKELGLRKLLNFGHTIGHAIESINMPEMYHGECVGLGMLMILENQEIKNTLYEILRKMGMPTKTNYDIDSILALIKADKKIHDSKITIVQVDEIGKGYLKDVDLEWIRKHMEESKL